MAESVTVQKTTFVYDTQGVEQTRQKVDQLAGSLDKLAGSQGKATDAEGKGSASSEKAAQARARMAAVQERAQRQLEAEARALALAQAAQDASALSLQGLSDAQMRAAQSAAAVQKAANDNSAALGKQNTAYAEAGKFALAHPLLIIAGSALAARALAGLAISAAGYLGTASAATAAFAEGSTAMGGAVASGGTLAARGLAVAGEAATVVAGGLAAYATKIEGATSVVGLLVGALRLIPNALLPIAAAFAVFQVASAFIGKAYDDLQKLIDLGQKAQSLDVGAPFLKSFESLGKVIGATTEQMDQALSKASGFLKDSWGQDNNNLSKALNSITATGAAGANGLQATALADTATTLEERLKAGLAAMKELDALGLHLASIQVGEKVLGPETVERMRITGTSAEQLSAALQAAAEKEVLKQEQVDRALQLNKNISDTKQAIADAWAVNLDFSAAATFLDGIWLRILQTVLSIVQAINSAIDGVVAFGATVTSAVGGAFSALAGQISGVMAQLGIISKQAEQVKQEVAGPPEAAGPAPQKITGRDLGYISTVVDGRKFDTVAAGAKQARQAAQEAASSYDLLIQKTQDHIKELDLEAQYVGKDTDAVIKLKLAHQLARAAQKDGTEVTDEMRAQWDKLGDSLASSTKRLEDSKRAFEGFKEGTREIGNDFASFADDLILGGQKLDEAFKGLAKTLGSGSLQALISGQGPFATIFGTAANEKGGLGGILGGKLDFGGLFSSDKIADALGVGAETGLGKLISGWLKEQKPGGGFFSSQLGQGLAVAGAGASVGYSSQSPLMGAGTGLLAGLATGNPFLAAAGPSLGIGGMIGKRRTAKDHPKPEQEKPADDRDQRPLAA